MKIAFHGRNARSFRPGFDDMVGPEHEIVEIGAEVETEREMADFASAEVIIGFALAQDGPRPEKLRLFHVPGAGYDRVDPAALPQGAALCNCFGHENAIAEYVMGALLTWRTPIHDADQLLRQRQWTKYWAGSQEAMRIELGAGTMGLLGFGHIGRTIAARAKAFGMRVAVANRSPATLSDLVDESYGLDDLASFMAASDYVVCSLPLAEEKRSLVDAAAFAAMRPGAVIVNVGRGPVIDEQALFSALSEKRIGGAVIDTWYVYPTAAEPTPQPSALPFHTLGNIVMTPHMSGWTFGTIGRRQRDMADNVKRLAKGEALVNRVI